MFRSLFFIPIFFMIAATIARAELTVPSIFSDHMVLQKAGKVPIWGKGAPGEAVSVSLEGKTAKTTVDADGKWRVDLNLASSPPGPFEMTIQGANTIKIADVLVGEVWLAGGQSNMARALENTNGGPAEVAVSTNPMLRQFKVESNPAADPMEDCEGSWIVASPEDSGKFTGVGYYFGKQLQNELKAPVGILSSSVGGTGSEPWTSQGGIAKDADLRATANRIWPAMRSYFEKKAAFVSQYAKWLKDGGREDKKTPDVAAFAGETAMTNDWCTATLPGPLTTAPGVVWLRNDITLSKNASLEKLPLTLGDIPGFEKIYWNGQPAGGISHETTTGPHVKREYSIPPALLKEGRNVLTIRIYAPEGGVTLAEVPRTKQGTPGPEWKMKIEQEWPAVAAGNTAPEPPSQPNSPSGTASYLFNGMINPLIPYAIKGIIWYQGESNTKRAAQYRTSFPLLINDWRSLWGQGDIPFYFVQLAAYQPKLKEPGESIWAETREAQSLALAEPNTAQAVIIDTGEVSDIHPRNKKTPGERLAVIALARDYGREMIYSGPTYASAKVEGHAIRLAFKNTEGGLMAAALPKTHDEKSLISKTSPLKRNSPDSELEGFAICGADHKWGWADARIDGDTVLVSSDKVAAPVAVRYAWADNPTCNLTNGSGIPASPFRTDDFPLSTAGVKY